MSTSSILALHLLSALLNWDFRRELSSDALGGFHFYEINELPPFITEI